ncbi:succinyl-diaminopimelate desuccinylase [Pinirhizobacter soli]|uniref:succinyl-diaminopimelate desuccinylase n=1 Tax=Pinirhizobacter soli TaxID=2786953 RepID=UPI00202A7546|nr:succinyl-diaminopimelate desuccinylase [Pinirhizobacter soli]
MPDVLDLACELIRRPSVTPADEGCQAMISERLATAGFMCRHLRFGEVDNLWATHGTDGPVLAFLGHTDVVPPGPHGAWASPPFEPTVRNGLLYGRGAADMKGSVAAMVVALEDFVRAYPDHPGIVALLITSDEEGVAVDGVKRVVETFQAEGVRIDYCVVGEPSAKAALGDLIRVGRRGSLSGTVRVRGIQGHVAYPEKALNPIHAFAPALAELAAEHWDNGNADFPPTSFQVSNLNSGTGANNVIPGELVALVNFRYGTVSAATDLQARAEATLARHGVDASIEWSTSGAPFLTPAGGRLREVAVEACHALRGEAPEQSTGGGTSDGRFIAPMGAEVVEVGPVNATIHKVDECVRIADLERLPGLYRDIMQRMFA